LYQALYRKYRPRTFSDVYGQAHITETLKNQLKAGRIFHAYLFTGSRGTGKTTCAKILAKAACCAHPQDGEPCNACEFCRGVDDGSLLDVLEIDAASNNGVDDIRDLREKAVYTPSAAKYRVYIIDEVHMLSSGAFNALLKTLEEPPAHVIFILATTEVHKLPATILSRCQRFDFHRITPELIARRVRFVCEAEELSITDGAARLIASLADGGMRDALSILDLCIGDGGEITEQTVADICGLAGREYLLSFVEALRAGDISAALELIGRLHADSVDMLRLCEEVIAELRNLMLLKTLRAPEELIVCSSEELEALRTAAEAWTLDEVVYALSVFEEALAKMGRGSRRTALEMAVVKFCTPALNSSAAGLTARLAALERAVKTGLFPDGGKASSPRTEAAASEKPVPPTHGTEHLSPKPVPPVASQTQPAAQNPDDPDDLPPWEDGAAAPPAGQTALPGKEEPSLPEPPPAAEETSPAPVGSLPQWSEILGIIAKTCPLMHGVLQGSTAYLEGDLLLIDCENSQFRDLVNSENTMYKDSIRNATLEILGKRCRLGPYNRKKQPKDPLDELLHKAENLGL
jgi:DNA polymerase-3 subunit gamma/tau